MQCGNMISLSKVTIIDTDTAILPLIFKNPGHHVTALLIFVTTP